MKKIIIILILLMFVVGCKFTDIQDKLPSKNGETPSGKLHFKGGKKGIIAEIVNPADDGTLYSNQMMNLAVRVTNKGEAGTEYEEVDGSTCIFVPNPKYFPDLSGCECLDFSLKGDRKVDGQDLDGEEDILTFDAGNFNSEEGDLRDFTLTAITRYEYYTYTIIKPCIKKDIYSSKKGECKASPDKNIAESASSGPVKITRVTQQMGSTDGHSGNLIFNVYVENIGDGTIHDHGSARGDCKLSGSEVKKVELEFLDPPGSARCDAVDMLKKEGSAMCTIGNVEVLDDDYELEMTLKLSYSYETIDSNKFEVI